MRARGHVSMQQCSGGFPTAAGLCACGLSLCCLLVRLSYSRSRSPPSLSLTVCLFVCVAVHSLWEVPSASTVALMLTFYHLLLSGDRGFLEWPQRSPSILVKDAREDLPPAGVKMDAAEALVRAQQWLRCANMEDVCCLLPDRGPTAACLRSRGWVPNPANSNVHGGAKSRAGGLAGNMAAGSRTHAHKKPFASPFYWAGFIVVGDG